jgi:hypothetical protein
MKENGRKILCLNGHKILQYFPFLGPPNFAQIGIFGLKINHLATLKLSSLASAKSYYGMT